MLTGHALAWSAWSDLFTITGLASFHPTCRRIRYCAIGVASLRAVAQNRSPFDNASTGSAGRSGRMAWPSVTKERDKSISQRSRHTFRRTARQSRTLVYEPFESDTSASLGGLLSTFRRSSDISTAIAAACSAGTPSVRRSYSSSERSSTARCITSATCSC